MSDIEIEKLVAKIAIEDDPQEITVKTPRQLIEAFWNYVEYANKHGARGLVALHCLTSNKSIVVRAEDVVCIEARRTYDELHLFFTLRNGSTVGIAIHMTLAEEPAQ